LKKFVCFDGTYIKVHPDVAGALKKEVNNALDVSKVD